MTPAPKSGAISTNDKSRYQGDKVRVAIIGVGNCASAFVQGVEYYKNASTTEDVPGLMHVDLGGYHISDIEFSAAFDINAKKVGKDLGQAIWADPNNTMKFAKVPKELGVPVQRGMTHDGLGKYLKQRITKAPGETADIVKILKETRTDVVVSYLPVGSEDATKWYVEQILEAGCGFVNCIPVFIAREPYWDKRFKKAGLPIVGDDIKSQVGATIVHRQLATLFGERGVKMVKTSQLNVGGNMDFFNMLERERLESKKISKTNAVTSIMEHKLPADDVYIGPSDYVPWLTDRKWAHIRVEGQAFGDVPLNVELKLEVWDSPNSAGIVIDAVRMCKLALNKGVSGQLDGPSSYLMKSPQNQRPDAIARVDTEKFIAKYGGKPRAGATSTPAKSATAAKRKAAPAAKRKATATAASARKAAPAAKRNAAPAAAGKTAPAARKKVVAAAAAKKAVAVKKVAVKKPAVKKPAVKSAAAKKPAASAKVAAKKPAVKKPAVKKAVVKKPAVKKAVVKAAAKGAAVKNTAAKKPAVRKPAVKKASVSEAAAKRAAGSKTVAKKPAAKKVASAAKPAAKKTVAKKPAAKQAAVKKPAVKKAVVKKAVVKKAVVKKAVVKKAAVKKAAVKKPADKKPAVRKPAAKQAVAKKPAAAKKAVAAKAVAKKPVAAKRPAAAKKTASAKK